MISDEKEFESLYMGVSQNWESRVAHDMFIRRSDFTRLMYIAIMRGVMTRAKLLLESP